VSLFARKNTSLYRVAVHFSRRLGLGTFLFLFFCNEPMALCCSPQAECEAANGVTDASSCIMERQRQLAVGVASASVFEFD